MKNQCDAVAPASTYTPEHRCSKAARPKKVGKRRLCSHHRAMEERRKP